MQAIASEPSAAYVYGREGGPMPGRDLVNAAFDTLCTEVLYLCHVRAECAGPITLVVHGRGLIASAPEGIQHLRCRATVRKGTAWGKVHAGTVTAIDGETMTCAMGVVEHAVNNGAATFQDVQVSIDGGVHWSRVDAASVEHIPCDAEPTAQNASKSSIP